MRNPLAIHLMVAAFIFGVFAWLGMPQTGFAQLGMPRDNISDNRSDYPGALKDSEEDQRPDRPRDSMGSGNGDATEDRRPNSDGTPDRVGGVKDCLLADLAVGECDRKTSTDSTPDCTNGPGDGQCGNSPSSGDGIPDFPGGREAKFGDGISDSTPDTSMAILNRPGENAKDNIPDRVNSDEYISIVGGTLTVGDRVGARDCAPADVGAGECDNNTTNQVSDNNRDRSGRDATGPDWALDGSGSDSTPDKVRANADDQVNTGKDFSSDSTPDGPHLGVTRDKDSAPDSTPDCCDNTPDQVFAANQDRKPDNTRSRSWTNWGSSREYGSGPSDKVSDGISDQGGLQTGAVGGGGGSSSSGCSFATSHTANPFAAGLFLLIVLAPMALIRLRRSMKK